MPINKAALDQAAATRKRYRSDTPTTLYSIEGEDAVFVAAYLEAYGSVASALASSPASDAASASRDDNPGAPSNHQPVGKTALCGNPEFEEWWSKNGVMHEDGVLRIYYKELQWEAWKATKRESIDLKEVRLLALAALGILPDELTCTPEEVKQDAIVIARTAKKYI